MYKKTREDAIDAADILNDMVGDFVTGVMVFKLINTISDLGSARTAAEKMCLSHLILSFDKWIEFYNQYHGLFEDQLHDECKSLKMALERRRVEDFRDRCIGHILDKKTKRPLHNSEILERLEKIVGNDLQSFLSWINNTDENVYPKTVVSIVEEARDYLIKEYKIKLEEFLHR